MSHVAKMNVEINDLEALKAAAEELGLEFVENQKTFKWYGVHVGDYPLPQGFSKQDMGRCDHALRVKGNSSAYEIGVCRARDGSGGWVLLWDFWAGGHGLTKCVGGQGEKMMQQYPMEVVRKHLRARGRRVTEERTNDGRVILRGKR